MKSIIESHSVKETISILMEANDLLKVQGMAKGSMFKAQKLLEPVMGSLKAAGWLESYSLKVVPYNDGYQLEVKSKLDYDRTAEIRTADNDYYESLSRVVSSLSMGNLYIYPGSYFEDDMKDGSGYVEGRTIQVAKKYPSFKVSGIKSRDDIKSAFKKYDAQIQDDIKVLKKAIK